MPEVMRELAAMEFSDEVHFCYCFFLFILSILLLHWFFFVWFFVCFFLLFVYVFSRYVGVT